MSPAAEQKRKIRDVFHSELFTGKQYLCWFLHYIIKTMMCVTYHFRTFGKSPQNDEYSLLHLHCLSLDVEQTDRYNNKLL